MTSIIEETTFETYSTSVCPECLKRVPMRIYEENNVIYLEKTCPEHGKFEDIYWGDAELFKWFYKGWYSAKYGGVGLENPHTKPAKGCPYDCGLCTQHRSHTVLGIIDVTNRCNMACPVCFAYAGAVNYVYEPSYEQLVDMIKLLRNNKPWACNSLQFSGGEPTLRNDLPALIAEAKKAGIRHVEVNTNGLRLAEDTDYFKKLLDAGLSTLYLQFDGLKEEIYKKTRGRTDVVQVKQKVVENARKVGLDSIVLVVTLAKEVNDKDLGEIIRYAVENHDVIRCVNIQPISMAGRARKDEMRKMRITVPDAIKLIEEQTNGTITRWDWRPVNWPVPISRGMEIIKNRVYPEFTMHPMCGAATFIVVEDDGSYKPITQYLDVDKFAEVFWDIHYSGVKGKRTMAKMKMLELLPMVKSSLVRGLIKDVVTKGSYEALGKFMRRIVMIGIMHFMDIWNFDLDRVQKCVIHYATPDGKIRPFCTYNSFHRTSVEKQFAISANEWVAKTGKKLNEPV
ncbi:MAG: radical SAM protein [Candidatus Bathyarchaeia archaeon]|nr:radical SAM protein [Candidatus Bathyarchaeota archaeon]